MTERLLEPKNFLQTPVLRAVVFPDDGLIPNSNLPLLLYAGALDAEARHRPDVIESLYRENGWQGSWRNGVYAYHHYHSVAHEVLACYSGNARILFGGEQGDVITIRQGDVAIIPAGVGHRNIGSSDDFAVVGAYPRGQTWDMNYGVAAERPTVLKNIQKVPLPQTDPIFGKTGPLLEHWVAS